MSTNRRQFLIGAGLTGFGLAGAGKLLADRSDPSIDSVNTVVSEKVPTVAIPTTKLLQRFAVIADTGVGRDVKIGRYETKQYAVADAMTRYHQKNPFNTVLMVGDNIYNKGEMSKIEEAFEIPYRKLLSQGVKFYAALGNHDVRTNNGKDQINYRPFNMQEKSYYTHTHGDVQFFVLETTSLVKPKSPDRVAQLDWLDRSLAASKAKWKIVYGHHNIYSAGVYKIDAAMKADVAPILKKQNVRLWINGHDHNYQRSKPIDGTTYLVCGGGGANLYPVAAQTWTAFAASVHSFGIVEVYQDQILLTGIDSKGQIIDRGLVNLFA
ncbi:MAG: metallophosphoesterase [Chamaesiphon sp.]|nr:metallophosphoesterase [Chamaesiphon sp.]